MIESKYTHSPVHTFTEDWGEGKAVITFREGKWRCPKCGRYHHTFIEVKAPGLREHGCCIRCIADVITVVGIPLGTFGAEDFQGGLWGAPKPDTVTTQTPQAGPGS